MPTSNDIGAELALLAQRIIFLRREKGLTQEKLAWASGITKATMSRIEAGKRYPSPKSLVSIAAALEVEVRDLFVVPSRSKVDKAMEALRLEPKLASRVLRDEGGRK